MFVRLVLIIGISVLMFGCTSDQVKEENQVEVEDLSNANENNELETSEAQAYGTEEDSSSSFSELDDPQSQLSVRIIYFEYDSSEIQTKYRSVVEAHSRYLSQNPDQVITLEGHADERGSREYNLALGERRAQSVKKQLVLLGASSVQIRLVSYGEERPAVEGHDEVSWQKNRRVEILY